jgi:hypothetical protein
MLPFCGTALEYDYTHLQSIAVDAAAVFDGMKLRFQTQDVQDSALVKWQSTTFASSRLAYKAGQRLHRALSSAYEADIHLRDFLLRACADEPFSSRVPEKSALSSSDAQEQLTAAITRYEGYLARRRLRPATRTQERTSGFQAECNPPYSL